MTDVSLPGCRPEPLGAYLKALGLLRLVGMQVDAEARGWWEGECFVLRSRLDADGLVGFLVDDYRPTPIVSPWNGGSGFKEEKNPAAVAALRAIEASSEVRLAPYRAAIAVAHEIYREANSEGWAKDEIVAACRSRLPDEVLVWIDATVVLTGDRESYPPLLGTGGNDGRFDFSKAFMDRVADVLCLRSGRGAPDSRRSRSWAREAMHATGNVPLLSEAIGQFDPGAAGGPNSSPEGAAPSLVNPWEWVLIIEGALTFASASARRLGSTTSARAAIPFTFMATAAGYATSAAEEGSRGELWAPLWSRPATAAEIDHLIGEGRADWRQRQARSALDAARAVATLGVDRGVDAFVRHGLLERNGLATAAVVLGRHRPSENRSVPIAAQLDPWLERLRQDSKAPAAARTAIRLVDSALFEHATRGGAERLQAVLVAASALEEAVARAAAFRARVGASPVRGLVARDWLPYVEDGSAEFDIARGIASQRDSDGASMRDLLRPVSADRGFLDWSTGPPPAPGLGSRPLDSVLADALARRAVDAMSRQRRAEDGPVGVVTGYEHSVPSRLESTLAWLRDDLDERRLVDLLSGLLLLDWRNSGSPLAGAAPREIAPAPYAVLAPFFSGRKIKWDGESLDLRVEADWPRLLAAGRVSEVLRSAARRLRAARLEPRISDLDVVATAGPRGARLAAVLSCPLRTGDASRLLRTAVREPNFDQQEER